MVFRYLDGTEIEVGSGGMHRKGRWREPLPTGEDPIAYQIPLRSLIPVDSDNIMIAGRIIDADPGAFGAVRVMVNCNQMGEAAGVAVAVCMRQGGSIATIDAGMVRHLLGEGGSIVPDC